ncbi:Glucooligosaccharide oxidase [Glonium stellatum]|uniref:Glucooligosaccharide oxidase n=1 Tax=Glonium stellatum TaxID=574774 RepID=A0A8E2ENE4_9PEZI|nr:Glucooligosaccharide oxidase [Glonium stellatum]
MAIHIAPTLLALVTVGVFFPSTVTSSVLQKLAAVDTCLTTAGVPTYASGSADFTQAIKPFNLRLPFTPVALAVPSTVAHVQAAVSCAASLGITVSAKSGGHSYASHGIGGENGHLIVDMLYFNNITVDKSSSTAMVGTGARLGNVATALYNQGGQAISHGTCPGVGVGGLALHGGYGFSSHTHGLTLDGILEATVVLANSTVVTASATQNPDLFWALRGAGASFGIVTNFKFQTFTAPSPNIVFTYMFSFGSQQQAVSAISAIQTYTRSTMPTELNMRFTINPYSTTLSGVYYGSQAAFTAAIQPLLSTMPAPLYNTVQSMGWLDTLTAYSNGALATTLNYDYHETFFAKSLMPSELSDAAITAFVAYWFNTAKSNTRDWYVMMDLHGGAGSAISKVAADATSYAHRDAIFKFQFYDRVDSGTYPSNGFPFLNGWVGSITSAMPNTTFGMYINYADSSLTADQAHTAYWLDHYPKLTTIKMAYDPKKVFSNPQAILST